MLNLCYWAKSAFMVDFFYFGQKLKTGALPGTACADTFEHGDITWCNSSTIPVARQAAPERLRCT